ncbi:MAG: hypothetical protein M0013_04630 [Actinomycetota bacterium]|nr:hypothetical protein [Actinomycetota bacterium]
MIRRCTVLITLGRSGQRDDLAWPPPSPRRASTDVQEVGSQPDERRRRIHDLPWASPGTDRAAAQSMLVPISTWEKLLAHAEDQLDLDLARRRLGDRRPWLSEEDLDAAVVSAMEKASGRELA